MEHGIRRLIIACQFTHARMRSSYSDFMKLFVREGAAYFVGISIVNIINVYFNYQYAVTGFSGCYRRSQMCSPIGRRRRWRRSRFP